MDRELVNDVAISITHLSLEAKEHFFFVVEHFKIGMIRLLDSLGTALGQLELTGKGLIFSIDVVAAARPSGRLIVRHELSHPTRLVTSLMETKIHNANEILVSGRRLGVYREELTAARDEVRYVRRVFKMDDVPHLLDGFPKPDAKKLEIELVEAGLMKIAKDGKKQALDIGIFDAPPPAGSWLRRPYNTQSPR